MFSEWMEYIPIFGPILRKCPYCGNKIKLKDVWCLYCGKYIK